jgi:hypothetical protein
MRKLKPASIRRAFGGGIFHGRLGGGSGFSSAARATASTAAAATRGLLAAVRFLYFG